MKWNGCTREGNLYELAPYVPSSDIICYFHSCIMLSFHWLARLFTFKHNKSWWLKYKQSSSKRFRYLACLMPKSLLYFLFHFFVDSLALKKETKQISSTQYLYVMGSLKFGQQLLPFGENKTVCNVCRIFPFFSCQMCPHYTSAKVHLWSCLLTN